jgi:Ca2+-transporting ATPase
MAYLGTIVEGGRGKGIAADTGMRTELGRIAQSVQEQVEVETPLQKQLARLGRQLGIAIAAICVVVFAVGYVQAAGDMDKIVETFLTAVSLAVAAIPEGLPAIVTITLAIGLQRMARRHALIRRLPAAEALGSATVICSDKTGTLTKGEMNVREVFAGGRRYLVEGEGFDPAGRYRVAGLELVAVEEDLRLALECAALCNDATLRRGEKGWEVQGDGTEGALLVAARRGGLDPEALSLAHPRVAEIPFTSERKRMTTVHAPLKKEALDRLRSMTDEDRDVLVTQLSEKVALLKGAPDILLPLCTHHRVGGRVLPLDDTSREAYAQENRKMAEKALRVLALASRDLPPHLDSLEAATVERDLVFLGLAGMMDAPRRDAVEAVQRCKAAGIKVVMITGDHKHTAMAIASEMGILAAADAALSGAELDAMSEADLEKIVDRVAVYARVSPSTSCASSRRCSPAATSSP